MANEYIETVLEKLSNNPTAQDLDFFIEAHARVGYLVAVARRRADDAESLFRFTKASEYGEARRSGAAKSATDAEQIAIVASREREVEAIRFREQSAKLSNLLSSIEQAINGIKFLGRATDVSLPSTRR